MESYSASKKNEIMPLAATWMDLETVRQSAVSQTVQEKYRMTSLICGIHHLFLSENVIAEKL